MKEPKILSHLDRRNWEKIIADAEWPRQQWKHNIFKSGQYCNLCAPKGPKDNIDDEEELTVKEDEDNWIEQDVEYKDSADVYDEEEEETALRKVRLISGLCNGRNMAQLYLYPGFGIDSFHNHLWRHCLAQGSVCAFGCKMEDSFNLDNFLLHLEDKHGVWLDFGVNLGIIKQCSETK